MRTKAELDQLAKSLKPTVEATLKECTDVMMNAKEVAEMLGVSVAAIHIRCSLKKMPYTKKHGRLYFSKNAITKYYLSN